MDSINKQYPLQVWLTSLVIAPIIFVAYEGRHETFDIRITGFLVPAVVVGCGLSLPVWFVYRLAFKDLYDLRISPVCIKLLLSVIAITGMVTTFYFFMRMASRQQNDATTYTLPASYAISILIAGFIFKLKKHRV